MFTTLGNGETSDAWVWEFGRFACNAGDCGVTRVVVLGVAQVGVDAVVVSTTTCSLFVPQSAAISSDDFANDGSSTTLGWAFLRGPRDFDADLGVRDARRRTCRSLYGDAASAKAAFSETRILEEEIVSDVGIAPDPDASSTACAEEVTPLSEGVEVPPPVPIRI